MPTPMFTMLYLERTTKINCSTSATLFVIAWLMNMSSIGRTFLVFAAVLLVVHEFMKILRKFMKRHKLPPGPRGFPIKGYIPFLKDNYHLHFTELIKKFGKVYQIHLGTKRVVVISDPALIREAFKQPVFSGRPDTALTEILEGYGVINSGGARWREQRSFLHSVLRDFGAKLFGSGDSRLENTIQSEVTEFCDALRQSSGSAFSIRVPLARAISNVVGSVLMSAKFDANDEGFARLLHLIEEGFRLMTLSVSVNYLPIMRFVPYFNSAYKQVQRNKDETSAYFAHIAKQHRETLDENNVRDFVDAFYVQQRRASALNKQHFFSDEQLLQVMGDIFSAGLETVSSLLEWCILYMILNPEVQQKVWEEIDTVVGKDRKPNLKDLPNMKYTEATTLEVLRRANVLAVGNAHSALADTELGGFHIPKGTHIVPNLWAVHMDPELWDEPEAFKPERFLVNNQIVKPSYFMPFSVGRRMCVGDTFTRMEVFLFLTNILQNFELRVPEGESSPDSTAEAFIALKPRAFNVSAVPRCSSTHA